MEHQALVTTAGAARLCGLSPRTLEKLRLAGGGPPFVKLGRAVRYDANDLRDWIDNNRRRSTSDPGPEGG